MLLRLIILIITIAIKAAVIRTMTNAEMIMATRIMKIAGAGIVTAIREKIIKTMEKITVIKTIVIRTEIMASMAVIMATEVIQIMGRKVMAARTTIMAKVMAGAGNECVRLIKTISQRVVFICTGVWPEDLLIDLANVFS